MTKLTLVHPGRPTPVKFPSDSKNSEQSPRPCSYDPTKVERSRDVSYRLKNLPVSRIYNTIRFLLSKIEREGRLSEVEDYLLLLAFDQCDNFKDFDWQQSKSVNLSRIKFLIECYARIKKLVPDQHIAREFFRISKGYTYRKFLLTDHSYFGLKKYFNVRYFLRKENLRLRKSPPPQRFIGVGYKDQGARRNIEKDGNQTWQEVAMDESFQREAQSPELTGPQKAILSVWGSRPEKLDLLR